MSWSEQVLIFSNACTALGELKRAGINEDLLIELNDLGLTFDEIADKLERTNELTSD